MSDRSEFEKARDAQALEIAGVWRKVSFKAGADWAYQRLEAELADLRATEKVYLMNREWIEDAKATLARYKQALEFYADVKNWQGDDDGDCRTIVDTDCYRNTNMNDDLYGGLMALKALAKGDE